jgi:hypothetical protein
MATTNTDGDSYSRGFYVYTSRQVRFFLWVTFLTVCMSCFYFILDFYFKIYAPKSIEYSEPCAIKLSMKIILAVFITPFCSFVYRRMKFDISQIFLHTFFFLVGSILLVMSMQTGKVRYYMVGYTLIKSSYVIFWTLVFKWVISYTNYWRYLSISKSLFN